MADGSPNAGADIIARQEELEDVRRVEEREWQEIARLFAPEQNVWDARASTSQSGPGTDYSDILDASHLIAEEQFEGGIFGQLVNPAARWFELAVDGDPELTKWGPVQDHLWQRANVIYRSLQPGVSAFYAEAPGWIGNTGMFGFGPFYQEERIGTGRFIDRALPIPECYFDTDADGEINVFHRKYALRGRQYKERFGDFDKKPIGDRDTVVCIHAVRPNPDFVEGAIGNRGKAWQSIYVSPDRRELRVEGGYYEFLFHVPMWRRRPGRPYPVGPGHRTRPDVATLQEMERTHLVAAQFAAEPPILAHEDSGLTAADIVPNAMLHGTMNEQGKQLMAVLNRQQNLQLTFQQSEQRRNAIRDAWFFGIMQLVNRPQMTATEFLGFQEEKLRLLGPNLVRLQTGGLSPFITRRNNILERMGLMPEPPEELQGRAITIEYVSPLAKAMKIGTARAVLQYQQAIEAMAVTDPSVRDVFNADGAARVVHDAMVGVPDVVRSPEDVAKIREARAQVDQEQQQLEQTGQAVTIAAEASHAAQANTLAKQRRAA
jgi:hypothetical protein